MSVVIDEMKRVMEQQRLGFVATVSWWCGLSRVVHRFHPGYVSDTDEASMRARRVRHYFGSGEG